MSDVVIYHNPRCSKSRAALKLLQDNGVEPVVVEYLKMPPERREFVRILGMLGMQAKDLVRTKEKVYKELGLSADSSEKELIEAMIEHPILIERPIVVKGDRAALGRPPENVLAIL